MKKELTQYTDFLIKETETLLKHPMAANAATGTGRKMYSGC